MARKYHTYRIENIAT
jgi:hypothetical protein